MRDNKFIILILCLIAAIYAAIRVYKSERNEPNEVGTDTDSPNSNNMEALTAHPNFSISELACKDAARTPVPTQYLSNATTLLLNLQVLRNDLGTVLFINSGYRTPAHNQSIGGKSNSAHLRAMAADIKVLGVAPRTVKATIERLISEGRMLQGGIGLYGSFVHYDIRGYKARW